MTERTVIVEFFGMPRARAGRKELVVNAATLGEALAAVVAECPKLAGIIREDGRIAPHYLLSLDGERFVTELSEPLHEGDRLLLFSADAGGGD